MLLCLSSNHKNASFELLEKLSFGAPGAAAALVESGTIVTGAVVLATCNRFEAYLDIDEPLTGAAAVAVASTLSAIGDASGVSVDDLRASITVHHGEDVASHLFAVTSGLESVVVGEDEISGQVARALASARTGGTTSRDLERLFQRASHTSKDVKNLTAIGGRDRSLVRLGLELASSRIADWSAVSVLIVGTGQYAATTVTALRNLGADDIRVFSPTGRAAAFATKYGLRASDDFAVDVVITCTTAVVLGPDRFTGTARRIVIDLGLPRNVDPAVARVPGVELLDLETISLHAPLEELTAHDDARALVRDAARGFTAEAEAEPAIVALRTHVFELLDAEIARARSRGAGDETESALRHLAGVLLHQPSVRAVSGSRGSGIGIHTGSRAVRHRGGRALGGRRGDGVKPFTLTEPIRTERLTLRLLTMDDVDDAYAYQSLEEVARYELFEPRTREQVAEKIEKWRHATALEKDDDYIQFAIDLDGRVIGELFFEIKRAKDQLGEIGWTINPAFQRQGYATEAATAVLELAFKTLELHRVQAELDPRNDASVALCSKLGMRHEAHFVADLWFKGEWGDTGMYAILEREWLAR